MRKIKHENVTKKDYEMNIAGRLWKVPEITFQNKRGSLFLNQEEIKKWHMAVANVICSEKSDLSIEEFLFLLDVAKIRKCEIAKTLHLNPSTITAWVKRGDNLPRAYSYYLKKWFWDVLFEENRTKDLWEELRQNSEYACEKKIVETIKIG